MPSTIQSAVGPPTAVSSTICLAFSLFFSMPSLSSWSLGIHPCHRTRSRRSARSRRPQARTHTLLLHHDRRDHSRAGAALHTCCAADAAGLASRIALVWPMQPPPFATAHRRLLSSHSPIWASNFKARGGHSLVVRTGLPLHSPLMVTHHLSSSTSSLQIPSLLRLPSCSSLRGSSSPPCSPSRNFATPLLEHSHDDALSALLDLHALLFYCCSLLRWASR
mmetsp:Transcript_20039/g.52427  ORF Transcript_20039/g.52427 Transcript_20039/m.52427 type:complete len:221 (-) Transcript_20039:752-1414(-)